MLDGIEADRAEPERLLDRHLDLGGIEGLHRAQDLDVLPLARLA